MISDYFVTGMNDLLHIMSVSARLSVTVIHW